MGLFDTITNLLCTELAEYIADHLGMDVNQISGIIKSYLDCTPIPALEPRVIRERNVPDKKPAIIYPPTCKFRIRHGNKRGELCGILLRNIGHYCSKHKNKVHNNIIWNNKAQLWVVENTNFVVESEDSIQVIGKLLGIDLVELDDGDIERAEKLHLLVTD